MNSDSPRVDFAAPARLLKWPSLYGQRVTPKDGGKPYTIMDASLDECVKNFQAKPASQHHLYEIHTEPQGSLVLAVLSTDHILELARLREFL